MIEPPKKALPIISFLPNKSATVPQIGAETIMVSAWLEKTIAARNSMLKP